jgi:DNA-binding FrmR family transcriptional regulator
MRGLSAFTPEGLAVPYLQYLSALAASVQHVARMPEEVLYPFSKYVAAIVSNSEMASSSQRIDQPYAQLQGQRQALNAQIGKCFQNGSRRTERQLGEVISRNADWAEVLHQCDSLATAINKIDRKALDRKIKECVELLSAVQRKIEAQAFGDMSSQVANGLANGTFQVASELEFYSVTHFRLDALATAVAKTLEHLQFVFDQKS